VTRARILSLPFRDGTVPISLILSSLGSQLVQPSGRRSPSQNAAKPSRIPAPCYWGGVRSGKRVMKPLRFGICTFGSVWALMVASVSISLFWAKM